MGVEFYNKFNDAIGDAADIDGSTFEKIVARVEILVSPAPLEMEQVSSDYMVALRWIALT